MSLKNKMFSAFLAGSMGLAMVTPVMAQENQVNDPNVPDIVKTLQIADGTTFENVFNFTAEFDSANSKLGAGVDAPKISTKSITVSQNKKTDRTDILTSDEVAKFTVPGEYVYTLAEVDSKIEGVTYDPKTYEFRVVVSNEMQDGQLTGKTKTQYFIGRGESKKSEAAFTNTFTKENAKLTVSKKVAGAYADQTYKFEFLINFEGNGIDTDGFAVAKGLLKDEKGSDVTNVEYGKNYKFTLAHNESLNLADLPTGTKYTVTETGVKNYVPSYKTIANGNDGGSASAAEGNNLSAEHKLIGEKENTTVFTNTNEKGGGITPTGIIMNNLPFILLVVLGTAGVGFYLASKRRMN